MFYLVKNSTCVCIALTLVLLTAVSPARSEVGDALKTFDWAATSFVNDPVRPYVYASISNENAVAIIDLQTLEAEKIFVGSSPQGMAITPDGSRLYVANSGSNYVGVVDLDSRELLSPLATSEAPRDVEIGNGRLWVLGTESLFQIDPVSGATTGPNVGTSYMVYSGGIEISPDQHTLYYGDYGLSPSSLYQFDVSNPQTPTKIWESTHGGSGSNGQDITLSTDGELIAYPNGAPYRIPIQHTEDMLTLGTLYTGAYPRELAFSPDTEVAYTVNTRNEIKVYDVNTFLEITKIATSGEASELSVDLSGQFLLASFGGIFAGDYGTVIFDTGRLVPEPGSLIAISVVTILSLTKRRRISA